MNLRKIHFEAVNGNLLFSSSCFTNFHLFFLRHRTRFWRSTRGVIDDNAWLTDPTHRYRRDLLHNVCGGSFTPQPAGIDTPSTNTAVLKAENTAAGRWSIRVGRAAIHVRCSVRRNALARKQFAVWLCTINTNCIWFQSVNARQLDLRRTALLEAAWSESRAAGVLSRLTPTASAFPRPGNQRCADI